MDEVIRVEPTALQRIVQGETESAMDIARRYPRNVEVFQKRATDMVVKNRELAASCNYVVPRGGKKIEGPSIRFAEIVASLYGNVTYGARILEEGAKFVTAQGRCRDNESGSEVQIEVRRRITDKYGKRFNDDLIGVTCNAACAIALRNAILKCIPWAFCDPIFQAAKKSAAGGDNLGDRVVAMLDMFTEMGVSPASVLKHVDRSGIEQITREDVVHLGGIYTAIRDGDTTVAEVFPTGKPAETTTSKGAKEALKKKSRSSKKTPAAEQPAAPAEEEGPPDSFFALDGDERPQ